MPKIRVFFWPTLLIILIGVVFIIVNAELYSTIKIYQKGELEYSLVNEKSISNIPIYKAVRTKVYSVTCKNGYSVQLSKLKFDQTQTGQDSIPFFKYKTLFGETDFFYTGKTKKDFGDFFDFAFIFTLIIYVIGLSIYFYFLFDLYKEFFFNVSLVYNDKLSSGNKTIEGLKKTTFYVQQSTPALIGFLISALVFYIVAYKVYFAEYSTIWVMMIYLLLTFFIATVFPYFLLISIKKFREGNSKLIWAIRLTLSVFILLNISYSFYELVNTGEIENLSLVKFGSYLYQNVFDLLG